MEYCSDCGTRKSGGVCPNCHEELYIFDNQIDYIDELSEDFAEKVKSQKEKIKESDL